MTDVSSLVDGLFRRESSRLVSSLTRVFGPARIDLAEDVVQETLVRALRTWSLRGVPDNPPAWLHRVARNLAIDRLRADTASQRHLEVVGLSQASDPEQSGRFEEIVRTGRLEDDQLRMMFVCCHPALSLESQICVTLKLLCGFGVEEIARGLREKPATVAQRIVRAKQSIRESGVAFDLPPQDEQVGRTAAVVQVLYLLFNEGYTASAGPDLVRDHLCLEAIRLAEVLASHPEIGTADVNALLALFYFNAARLGSRTDLAGDMLLLESQDRTRWNTGMISRGARFLERAMRTTRISRYHLEAGIASLHVSAQRCDETDWQTIVELYDQLLDMTCSPIVALHRAVAIGVACGPEVGLEALESWRDNRRLSDYYLFHAVLAELYGRKGDRANARTAYDCALSCACSAPERRFLKSRSEENIG